MQLWEKVPERITTLRYSLDNGNIYSQQIAHIELFFVEVTIDEFCDFMGFEISKVQGLIK